MPTPPLSQELCDEAIELVQRHGTVTAASEASGIPRGTLEHRHRIAIARKSGMVVTGRSTLRNADGEVVMEWTKTAADKEALRAEFQAFVDEAAKPLTGLAPYVPAPAVSDMDLIAVYPIGDHHYGMKADPDETGESCFACEQVVIRVVGA